MDIENSIKNENQNWLDILVADKNMDMEYLEDIFSKVDYNLGLAVVATREKMLKSRTLKDEAGLPFKCDKTSLEKTFLEPISDFDLKYIKIGMEVDKWTLEELYEECKKFGVRICLVVGCRKSKDLEA